MCVDAPPLLVKTLLHCYRSNNSYPAALYLPVQELAAPSAQFVGSACNHSVSPQKLPSEFANPNHPPKEGNETYAFLHHSSFPSFCFSQNLFGSIVLRLFGRVLP